MDQMDRCKTLFANNIREDNWEKIRILEIIVKSKIDYDREQFYGSPYFEQLMTTTESKGKMYGATPRVSEDDLIENCTLYLKSLVKSTPEEYALITNISNVWKDKWGKENSSGQSTLEELALTLDRYQLIEAAQAIEMGELQRLRDECGEITVIIPGGDQLGSLCLGNEGSVGLEGGNIDELLLRFKSKLQEGRAERQLHIFDVISDNLGAAERQKFNDDKITYHPNYSVKDFQCRLGLELDHDVKNTIQSLCDEIHGIRLNGESVYVHCNKGVTRSASVVIAYLMIYEDKTYREAFLEVLNKRTVIDISHGLDFVLQLIEQELRGNVSQLEGTVAEIAGIDLSALDPEPQPELQDDDAAAAAAADADDAAEFQKRKYTDDIKSKQQQLDRKKRDKKFISSLAGVNEDQLSSITGEIEALEDEIKVLSFMLTDLSGGGKLKSKKRKKRTKRRKKRKSKKRTKRRKSKKRTKRR